MIKNFSIGTHNVKSAYLLSAINILIAYDYKVNFLGSEEYPVSSIYWTKFEKMYYFKISIKNPNPKKITESHIFLDYYEALTISDFFYNIETEYVWDYLPSLIINSDNNLMNLVQDALRNYESEANKNIRNINYKKELKNVKWISH